ncbi:MAG: Pr6Pr family membrane protein [Clostridia bacterium]|nr:Pr6Pr family membrane protein [Clostridia bacterium]
MNINNRIISLSYRMFALLLGLYGITYDLGIMQGKLKIYNLFYFTIISNIFCFGLFAVLIAKTIMDIRNKGIYGSSSISPHIKGEITISIILTMSVYHFILIPYALKQNPYQTLELKDIIFHYIIPVFTVFDWILFDEKKRFKWYDPLAWVIGPTIYILFVYTQAIFGVLVKLNSHMNRYVYIFLDIGKLGTFQVIQNVLLLSICFVIVGYMLYGIDRIKIKVGGDY